jgi:tetratricopeptide (TPR) repeat protein
LKPTIVVRNYGQTSEVLSWDTFRQNCVKLQEKIETLVKESNGSLDRVMAEELVDEIIVLRRDNPLRTDELLVQDDYADLEELEDGSVVAPKRVLNPVIERYESLLTLAANSRDLKLVLILYDEILQRELPITPVILNTTLRTLLSSGDPSKAQIIFRQAEFLDSGTSERPYDFMTLFYAMQIHYALGDEQGMTNIYKKTGEMTETSSAVRSEVVQRIVAAYLTGLASIGYHAKSTLVYEQIQRDNPAIVNLPSLQMAMIESYSNLGDFNAVFENFEILASNHEIQVPPAIISHAIVSALVLKKVDMAKQFYDALCAESEQQQQGRENLPSFQQFVDLAAEPSRIPKTQLSSEDEVPHKLVQESPTKDNYEQAIVHYAKSGNLQLTDSLWNEYRLKHIKSGQLPSIKVISALFQGAARLNNAKYLPLVLDFEKMKIPPSLARSLLQFHIQRHDTSKAIEVFFKILNKYPSVIENAMCTSVMQIFLEAPSFVKEKGISVFEQIIAAFPNDMLDISFFNHALSLFTAMEYAKGVSEVLAQIKRRGILPNTPTYNCLMHIYLKKPDYRMAINTYTDIIKAKLEPDTESIMALITALGESKSLAHPKSVSFLRDQMDRYSIEPNEALLEVLRKATTIAQNPNAFGVLMRALVEKYQIHLTASNYNSWISALLSCDQITKALELAKHVISESRRDSSILTFEFCAQLALAVSKESGSDFKQETIDRWANENLKMQQTLDLEERAIFSRDVAYWSSLIKDEPLIGR